MKISNLISLLISRQLQFTLTQQKIDTKVDKIPFGRDFFLFGYFVRVYFSPQNQINAHKKLSSITPIPVSHIVKLS